MKTRIQKREKDGKYHLEVVGFRPNYDRDGEAIGANMQLSENMVNASKKTTLPLGYGGTMNGLSSGLAFSSLYTLGDDNHVGILVRNVNEGAPKVFQAVQFDITGQLTSKQRPVLDGIVEKAFEGLE
ncbi:MAG: hypothetical protein Q7R56_01115 [Nanoarchaeota archaeon]|nr:hypothetical protein [Nanoarchaeota archaeon]